jgi:hypothetical protein
MALVVPSVSIDPRGEGGVQIWYEEGAFSSTNGYWRFLPAPSGGGVQVSTILTWVPDGMSSEVPKTVC